MIAEKEKTENKEKAQKPVKKTEKYIWFLASAVIAQRTSIERFGYADEESETADKTKYALTSILYYIFIIIAVAYAFLALWVSGVFSI